MDILNIFKFDIWYLISCFVITFSIFKSHTLNLNLKSTANLLPQSIFLLLEHLLLSIMNLWIIVYPSKIIKFSWMFWKIFFHWFIQRKSVFHVVVIHLIFSFDLLNWSTIHSFDHLFAQSHYRAALKYYFLLLN